MTLMCTLMYFGSMSCACLGPHGSVLLCAPLQSSKTDQLSRGCKLLSKCLTMTAPTYLCKNQREIILSQAHEMSGCKTTQSHYCKVFYFRGIWERWLMIRRLETWLQDFEMSHNNIMKKHILVAFSLSLIITFCTRVPFFKSPMCWMPTSLLLIQK